MSGEKAKFCFNNFIEDGFYTVSSSASGYASSNLISGIRSQTWRANGNFDITNSNNKVYINSTTYTLSNGSYTASTLMSHFNSLTGQTLTRGSTGRFVITLGSSGTLNLSTTTNAAWSTLGFLGSSDVSGTAFTADERRYNTKEWILTDTLLPQLASFACLIPANETSFGPSNATITLQGNNVDLWDTPEVEIAMTVTSSGAYANIPTDSSPCRYWRILIEDTTNPTIEVSKAYVGSAIAPDYTNIATGFQRSFVDPSVKTYSENGSLYVERRSRYTTISSTTVQFLKDTDLQNFEELFYDLGQGRPFFLVIDPGVNVSRDLSQFTYYVFVEGDPTFQHVLSGYHNMSFSLREVI